MGLSSFPVLPRPPAGPHAAETLMPARYHRGHNSPPPGIRSGLTWIAEKTDLSFPWRSAQARDPRHRTAFFGLDIIRHGLGDSEDRTGSERIFQVSSGTRRLGNQTGSVDQRQARNALRPRSEVSVLRVSSSTAETAELSGATQPHSGERYVRVGHH
jgi:hypothetical protein